MQSPHSTILPDDSVSPDSVSSDNVSPATAASQGAGQNPSPASEPVVAQASPAGWRNWLLFLVTYGRERIAALGLTLLLGFGVALLSLYAFAELADEVMEAETLQVDNAVLAALLRCNHRSWTGQRGSPRRWARRWWLSSWWS